MPIAVLPPKVAATIAAGEVVERPASVVKELVENAIDAGARNVRVEIERGGLDLIRVTDDGCGISSDELEVACQRHATSKLRSASDLAKLQTLGFRGEALPSIIAAADVQIRSRTNAAAAGAALRYRGGSLVERQSYGGAVGTSVTVKGLFLQQPARLKFLRTPASEGGQVAAVVQPYAIAYPEVRFSLLVDGRGVLQTTGSGDLRDAAARVLGAELAADLLEVEPALVEHDSGIAVSGLIGPPAVNRATRTGISIFVNRRWVQPRRLAFAVEQAYDTMLMQGRHPVAIVSVTLPPADLDVNVHPAKAEVRFRDERAVFGAILAALRRTLAGQAPVPDFELGVGSLASNGAVAAGGAGDEQTGPVVLSGPQPSQTALWQSLLRPEEHRPESGSAPRSETPRMPLLRVVGQTGGTYVVAEGPTGMYLIDQHAAHERVLYERIRTRQAGQAPDVQGLLAPAPVELTPQQATALAGYGELLAKEGFAWEPFGEQAVLVRALPAVLAAGDPAKALANLLEALAEEREAPSDDRLAKTLACHGSVRAGKVMSLDEMRELVVLLEECEAPRTCPHGRPTMVHLSTATLEREFRRR
jgi:DNA mismatch repair protein MutL